MTVPERDAGGRGAQSGRGVESGRGAESGGGAQIGRRAQDRRLDRHLFASNVSAYNSAWETYGWTEGLDRVRAGRLEERVPWGAELAEWAEPPTLVHGSAQARGAVPETPALAALGMFGLPEAFLPLDGRLGYCVSGIVRPSSGGVPSRPPRIATHTLLFDESLFREIDGFPQGLHMDLSVTPGPKEASWFAQLRGSAPAAPGALAEFGYTPDRDSFRRARLREVDGLARTAVAALGAKPAQEELEDVYRTVGRALDSAEEAARGKETAGGPTPVAGAWREARILLRLAWLSLPLVDRARVFYSMLDLRGRHPTPCLAPVAAAHPSRTAPASSAAPSSRPAGVESDRPGPLSTWAALVIGEPREYARLGARLDARNMSLYRRETEPYIVHWSPARLGAVDLLERARLESQGAGRWRGLGWLAAADLSARPPDRPPEWIEAVLREPLLATNSSFHDGLVRGLGGKLPGSVEAGPQEARVAMARLAVLSGVRARRRKEGLALLVAGMRFLASAGNDAGEIGAAVRGVREHDGDAAAGQLASIAVRLLGSVGREADVPAMVEAASLRDPIGPSLAQDLVRVFLTGSSRMRPYWQHLLGRVWLGVTASGAGDSELGQAELEALQRLAWVERRMWGATPLVALAAEGRPGAVALARRLMEHEPGPPLSVFLAMRSVVRRSGATRRSRSERRRFRKRSDPA